MPSYFRILLIVLWICMATLVALSLTTGFPDWDDPMAGKQFIYGMRTALCMPVGPRPPWPDTKYRFFASLGGSMAGYLVVWVFIFFGVVKPVIWLANIRVTKEEADEA